MELYSKQKVSMENLAKVCRYDLPLEFRNQVIFIWAKAAGYSDNPVPRGRIAPYDIEKMVAQITNQLFNKVRSDFCEEHGLTGLPEAGLFDTPSQSVRKFFQSCPDDQALDIIQLTFNEILAAEKSPDFLGYVQPSLGATEAVEKLNARFQERAIGFRLDQGRIVRLDSEFLHAETTEPALTFMHAKGYEGALEEFQLAHKYYRQGPDHYDDCLTNCLKALESTLQKIIQLRKWNMPGEAKFDNLFAEVKKRGLFPPFLGTHIGELKKFLQTVAVIRNEEGGHGSGPVPNKVPEHLVAYQIHLTGSAIVFLIHCNEEYGKRRR